MKRYQSHKIVEAAPIVACHVVSGDKVGGSAGLSYVEIESSERVTVPKSFFSRGMPAEGDYLVRYEDGYLSWSPKKAFEDGYTEYVVDHPEVYTERQQ